MKPTLTEDPRELLMYLLSAAALILFCLVPVSAQQDLTPPKVEVKGTIGGSFFGEEIPHGVVGGSFRFYMTRRWSFEPELLYMRHSAADEDFVFTPSIAYDITDPTKKVVPYVVGGVGVLSHRSRFGSPLGGPSTVERTSNTWTAGIGGGVKIFLTDRLYIAPEARIGREPTVRGTVSVGYVISGRR